MLDNELKSKINKLWDKFWSNGLSNPIDSIEQMSYLLFMKKLEDEDNKKQQEASFVGEKYESIFKNNENCKWSVWSIYPAEKILAHVRDLVFKFMRELGEKNSFYNQYMKGANFIIPIPSLLIEAVNIINDMHIKEQNQDTQGDIYEYLLNQLQTSGKNGQFRTPRHIINMMTELIDPKYGEKVLDPACGTAGFLLSAYKHIISDNKKEGISTLTSTMKKILDDESIYGFDNDEKMVKISLMNLMMHGIRNPKIQRLNTLSKNYEEQNMYDIILANPPFKGSINESEMNEKFKTKTKKTELLFLELMYRVLSPTGRCSVIVPDGVLFGSSNAHKNIRKMLLEQCRLDMIISMPSGVFKPYAGVSTAVLVFNKGEPTKKVLYYQMESDGYTLDDKRNPIDEKGDIPDIIKCYKERETKKFDDRKSKCFYVSIEEIKENEYDLSINKYKKIEYEEIHYEPPKKIIKTIEENEKEIINLINELKNMI
jgi:type I restriction enzyme M protein